MTSTDIGIEPGAGINPPSLSLKQQTPTNDNTAIKPSSPPPPLDEDMILEQCQMRLSPQQLASITLGKTLHTLTVLPLLVYIL